VVRFRIVRWRGAAFVVVGALVAGCFNFGSVSGGSPRDAGPIEDAGLPSSDAQSPAEGDGEASVSDAGYCASLPLAPTFCDDFDEYGDGASTPTLWDQPIGDNGTVSLTTTLPVSPPYAMIAQTNASATVQETEADVLKVFSWPGGAPQPVLFDVSFEMEIVQWDPENTGQIVAFEVIFKNSPTQFNQIVVNLNSLGASAVTAQLAENAQGSDGGELGYNSYLFTDHPATGKWIKVEMILSVSSPSGTQSNIVTVKVDGTTEIDKQALQVPLQGGTPNVHLGIGYAATPATFGWEVHYDNFAAYVSSP
jgi:hypothetical protein